MKKECKWIIFFNDATGRHGCVILGSLAAMRVEGTAVETIVGTEPDAIEEARRLDRDRGIFTGYWD